MSAAPRRSKSGVSLRSQSTTDPFAGFENEDIAHSNAVTAAERAFHRTTAFSGLIDCAIMPRPFPAVMMDRPNLEPVSSRNIRFADPTAMPGEDHALISRPLDSRGEENQNKFVTECSPKPKLDAENTSNIKHHQSSRLRLTNQDPPTRAPPERLGKAKSMFFPNKPTIKTSRSGIPKAGSHLRRRSVRSSESLGSSWPYDMKEKPSTTFTQHVKGSIVAPEHESPREDAAVRLAREEFSRQQDQQVTAYHQPPHFPNLHGLRMVRKICRSQRVPSSEATEQSLESFRAPRYRSRAQRLSTSVRSRLKTIFHRTTHHPVQFPAEELQISRRKLCNDDIWLGSDSSNFSRILALDVESPRPVDSQDLTTRWFPCDSSYGDGSQMPKSVTSRHDSELVGSRIASWSDSTPLSSVNLPLVLDKKRLSVINEDLGPCHASQPDPDSPNLPAFRQPLRPSPRSPQMESQRIFSALQREIERKNSDNPLGISRSDSASTPEMTTSTMSDSPFSPGQRLGKRPTSQENPFKHAADLNYNWNRRSTSNLRGSFYEIGSSFFPATKRIERDRGANPFRKLTKPTLSDGRTVYGAKLSANASEMDQEPFADNTATLSTHVARAQSLSIYPSNSDASASSIRPPNPFLGLENFGTAEILEPSHTIVSKSPDRIVQTDNSVRSGSSSMEWQFELAAQAMLSDPTVIKGESLEQSVSQSHKQSKEWARTSEENDMGQISINGSTHGHRFYSREHQRSLSGSIEFDGAPSYPFERVALKDITPQANSEVLRRIVTTPYPKTQTGIAPPTRWEMHEDELVLPENLEASNGSELSHGGSIQSRDGPKSSPCTSAYHYSPQRLEPIRRLHSQSSQLLKSAEAHPRNGVRAGSLSQFKSLDSQIALPENLRLHTPSRSAEIAGTRPAKGAGFDRSRLVDSFLRDRRRVKRTNPGPLDDAVFL